MAGGVGNLRDALALIRAARFYVYVLRRPSGEPFYVGKGSGDRIAQHARNAAGAGDGHRLRVIRTIKRAGGEVGYEIAGRFADEAQAFEAERLLIREFGRADLGAGPLTNYTDGGEGAANPSTATLAKRRRSLQSAMLAPAVKAAALRALRSNEDTRKASARASCQTQQFRAECGVASATRWSDPDYRARVLAASDASRTDEWRSKLNAALARNRADPDKEAKRLAALSSDATRQKMSDSRKAYYARKRGI